MVSPMGQVHVEPPAFRPTVGGIFSVAPLQSAEEYAVMGVVYETEACADGNFVDFDAESCLETAAKTFDLGEDFEYGERFAIYAAKRCTMLGNDFDTYAQKAATRLEYGEQSLIEEKLWSETFRERATDITPVGGAVPAAVALGLLAEYAATHYKAVPIFHAGMRLSTELSRELLDVSQPGKLKTRLGADFVAGSGYVSSDGPDQVINPKAAPTLTKGAAGAGGTFAAGTYYWKLTAIDALGETTGSNEVNATLTLNQQQVLNWVAIPGATGYKLYRGTAAGAENVLVKTLGAVTTYTDTSTSEQAPATIPTVNTTGTIAPIEADEGEVWFYVTGAIELRAGETLVNKAIDPQTNKLFALAEKQIVPTVDCLTAAIRVELEQ